MTPSTPSPGTGTTKAAKPTNSRSATPSTAPTWTPSSTTSTRSRPNSPTTHRSSRSSPTSPAEPRHHRTAHLARLLDRTTSANPSATTDGLADPRRTPAPGRRHHRPHRHKTRPRSPPPPRLHTTRHPPQLAHHPPRTAPHPPTCPPTPSNTRVTGWQSRPAPAIPRGLGLAGAEHPLLGIARRTGRRRRQVFTARLSLDTHPWLADHAVHGTVLLPGTAFVELALHAAERGGHRPCRRTDPARSARSARGRIRRVAGRCRRADDGRRSIVHPFPCGQRLRRLGRACVDQARHRCARRPKHGGARRLGQS